MRMLDRRGESSGSMDQEPPSMDSQSPSQSAPRRPAPAKAAPARAASGFDDMDDDIPF